MISYMHAPLLATCFFLLLSMRRFWLCIDRMGFTKEVSRRAPSMFYSAIAAATLAILPFGIALADWLGIIFPCQSAPLSPVIWVFLSLACLVGCISVLRESGERFAGHWAGTRESALRTVADLRTIDASQLAHALDVAQAHEAAKSHGTGYVIDGKVQEIQK